MKGVQHNFHIKSASCSRPKAFGWSPTWSSSALSLPISHHSQPRGSSRFKTQNDIPAQVSNCAPLWLPCASLPGLLCFTFLSENFYTSFMVRILRFSLKPHLFTSASLLTYLPNTEALCVLVTQSGLTPCDPMDYITHQAARSMGFSRQEYWNGLPFPSPGDLPNTGI